ncbi:MAG TPA: HEAT repeat domain-containing protein [Planctomycetota bacterium]|nr:HEAT repeat domain-containing protein [Planctomycetota bacterium]
MARIASCFALLLSTVAFAATPEDGPIAILQSDRPVNEKAFACRQLKQIGTVKAVPALAACLGDKDTAHSARYALESMPFPEAGAALRQALDKATGLARAGIIDSIGERRDKEAVPALVKLVSDADAHIASSAACSLGKIGGPEAAAALKAARPKAPAALKQVFADALLLCADNLGRGGDKAGAAALYKEVYQPSEPEHVRTAAFLGMILSADDPSPLLASGLTGSDRAAQRAALDALHELKTEAATKAAAAQIAKASPQVQVALIEVLAQRGDAAAAPAIIEATRSTEPPVRVAALRALGFLGEPAAVAVLAEAAAKSEGATQEAAKEALARIRGTGVREAMAEQLGKASPAAQAELVRALGVRRDTAAVPALLKMAKGDDAAARAAALRSLGQLADETAVAELVGLLVRAVADADREAIEKALGAICSRSQRADACAAPILAAVKSAAAPARASLLRAIGRLNVPGATQALRAGVEDKEPAVRDAAIRTLAENAGLDAAPDLLRLAKEAAEPAHRVLALRGYWRLAGLAGDKPLEERWRMCEAAMAASQRPEEKKLGLTELASLPHPGALKLAESLCADAAVKAEAEAAAVRIAAALLGSHRAEAKAALDRLAANASPATRAAARKALDALDQHVGYVTAWQVAGPYRQQGKQCQELFDIAFPPEQQGAKVEWKALPPPADPALFWQADLLPIAGGDQCVVYLRTRVFAPRELKGRLEIGTDDGIKLWINGKLVHSNNVMRPIVPGQDKAQATLQEGANDFLLKITQNNMGFAACVRIRAADGSPIQGLRFEPGPPK